MSPVGFQRSQEGVCYSGADRRRGPAHKTQITLLPTSSERLSISPALLFTNDQTQRENNSGGATKRK